MISSDLGIDALFYNILLDQYIYNAVILSKSNPYISLS